MQYLNNFDKFNEGKISNFFKKTIKFFAGNKSVSDALDEYDIETRKIDNYEYMFYHKNRLIARVFQPEGDEGETMNRPVFKIFIYLYESEIKNKNNWMMKTLDPDKEINGELRAQKETPYFKLAKKAFAIEWLVQAFYEFWAAKTKSGRATTNKLNAPKQSPNPLGHFSNSGRKGKKVSSTFFFGR